MEDINKFKDNYEMVSIWFGFPLNKTYSVVLFVLSFLGLMSLPALIIEYIYYLFYYNSFKDYYGLINIIFYSVCFILSLYTFLKVVKGIDIQDKEKKAFKSPDTHIRWFGIHLKYNQALVLFALSINGILFISYYSIMFIFDYVDPYFGIQYLNLDTHLINIALLIICIFTVYRIKKSQIKSENAKELNKFSLFLFILSMIFIICTISPILFATGLIVSNILYSSPYFGFIPGLITLIIGLSLFIPSALNIKRKYNFSLTLRKSSMISKKQKLFGFIKLKPKMALILLSFSIFVALSLLFDLGFGIFISRSIIYKEIDLLVVILITLCLYTINFILKKNRLEIFLESYNEEKFPKNKWFGLEVNKRESTIIFWLSLFSGSYLIYFIIFSFIKPPGLLFFSGRIPEFFDFFVKTSFGITVQCLMVIFYSYSMIVTRKFRNS